MSLPAPAPLLIYDGDCGFCTHTITWLYRHARPTAPATPYQAIDLTRYGQTRQRARYEMLWVDPDGHVHGGVRAFAGLLRTADTPWRHLGRLLGTPPVRWLAHPIYRLVARYRHRMPGGTAACALPAPPHNA